MSVDPVTGLLLMLAGLLCYAIVRGTIWREKAATIDRCPMCYSRDRDIRCIMDHPTEDALCISPWHG